MRKTETVTCCECGKITAGKKEGDLFICPECWARFKALRPHEQLQDLMKRLGGESWLTNQLAK